MDKPSFINGTNKLDGFPLLVIKLVSYGSVPEVFYNGEKISKKVSVTFDWTTNDATSVNLPDFKIEYAEVMDGHPAIRTISCNDPLKSEDCAPMYEVLTINEIRESFGLKSIGPEGDRLFRKGGIDGLLGRR